MACEPKATDSLVLVADVAAACRPTHATGTTSKRVNVALLERSSDAATRSMSRFTRLRSDMPTRACRSGSVRGATSKPLPVARRAREGRHARATLSLDELVKGDMPGRVRRLTHGCSVTSIDDKVAPSGRPERHVARSMSLHPIIRSDMDDRAKRHSRPHMSPYPSGKGDMETQSCRCTGDGEATFNRARAVRRPGTSRALRSADAVDRGAVEPEDHAARGDDARRAGRRRDAVRTGGAVDGGVSHEVGRAAGREVDVRAVGGEAQPGPRGNVVTLDTAPPICCARRIP